MKMMRNTGNKIPALGLTVVKLDPDSVYPRYLALRGLALDH